MVSRPVVKGNKKTEVWRHLETQGGRGRGAAVSPSQGTSPLMPQVPDANELWAPLTPRKWKMAELREQKLLHFNMV